MNNKEKQEVIGKALKLVIKATKNGMSNYKIAKDTNIAQKTIGNYVNGETKPNFANANILIRYFEDYIVLLYHECFSLLEGIYNEKLPESPNIRNGEVNGSRFEKLKSNINILLDFVDCEQKLKDDYPAGRTELEFAINDDLTYLKKTIPLKTNIVEERLFDKKALHLKEKAERKISARPLDNINYMNIPFVPIHAQAGYMIGYGDQEYIDELPTIPIIVDRSYKGKYRVFEVEGDSMDDGSRNALYDGDKILCRDVSRELWTSRLHINDWYFVIVHKTEGIIVKKITEHNTDTGDITCHSLNPIFRDRTLSLNDISELYNVIKIVDRNARI
jgi:hypothetical protein